MSEYALALDVGDGFHGWCLGDVSEHPPPIVAAGVIGHAAALSSLGRGVVHAQAGTIAPAPDAWSVQLRTATPAPRILLPHPPILERFVVHADDVFASGGRTIEYGGELAGAWYAATGTEVVKTSYAETCRDMHGKVLKCAAAFEKSCALYPPDGGGKGNQQIGTKTDPGPLAALNPRGMYSKDWPSEDKTHHRDAFLALLWWAYRRRRMVGAESPARTGGGG